MQLTEKLAGSKIEVYDTHPHKFSDKNVCKDPKNGRDVVITDSGLYPCHGLTGQYIVIRKHVKTVSPDL